MFKWFSNSEDKIISKLRSQFDDIRQRVLFGMNSFEQYSFCSACEMFEEEIEHKVSAVKFDDPASWLKIGQELLGTAQQGFRQYERVPGIDGEGGRAGTEGVAFLGIKYMIKAFKTPQSTLLMSDINGFEKKMTFFMEQRKIDPYFRMTA